MKVHECGHVFVLSPRPLLPLLFFGTLSNTARLCTVSVFDLKQQIVDLKKQVAEISDEVDNVDMGNKASLAAMAASIRVLSPSITRVDAMVEKVSQVGGSIIGLKKTVNADLMNDRERTATRYGPLTDTSICSQQPLVGWKMTATNALTLSLTRTILLLLPLL